MPTIETIKVEREGGFMIINKDDFDPKIHKLVDEKPKARETPSTKKEPKKPGKTTWRDGSRSPSL